MYRSPARTGTSVLVACVFAFTLAGAFPGCSESAGESTASQHRRKLDSGAMTPAELRAAPIAFELDVPYTDTGYAMHRLDVYLPRERAVEPLPVVVFVHGGGWIRGSKADGARTLVPLVATGRYAGIATDYRLTGEARWPAQIHDCKAAIRWVRANAGRYGFDPERIGVVGRSAGGHLALLLGTTGDEPALEGDLGPHLGTSSRVCAVVNYSGPTDLYGMLDEPSTLDRSSPDALEARLLGGPLVKNRELAAAASPVTYASTGDPPVLTIHGTDDAMVNYRQALLIDAALQEARVPSHLVTIQGGDHGDFGSIADDRMLAFLEQTLHDADAEIDTTPIAMPP